MSFCHFLAITFKILRSSCLKAWPVGCPFPSSLVVLTRFFPVLHELRLIHTDLKPENILLVHNDFSVVQIPGKVYLILLIPLPPLIDPQAELDRKSVV